MSFVMFVVGILTAATGAVMVGFGVPINEFSIGNTLIIAGTSAFVGGLIIVALSAATRQLGRLMEALETRSAQRPNRSSEGLDQAPASRGPASRSPGHSQPRSEPVSTDAYGSEPPRFPTLPREASEEPFFGRQSSPAAYAPHGDVNLSVVEEIEEKLEVSLSPRAPQRRNIAPDLGFDPKPARAPTSNLENQRSPAVDLPRTQSPQFKTPGPNFDSVWPPEPRAQASESAPLPRPATRSADASRSGGLRLDNLARQEAPYEEPARPPRSNGDASHSKEPMHSQPTPLSILKSGVVDGMAYTLYTDGSIEAELAQGVVRFGSIEELRNHLEKNAS